MSDSLLEVKAPTLYLRATDDSIVSLRSSELILSLKPTIKIIDIQGPHCLLQTSPEQSLHCILEFLQLKTNTEKK